MKSEYADSTIAISIYNTLVVFGGPMDRFALFDAVRTQHHRDLSKYQFDVSLHKLSRLKMIRVIDGRFQPIDQTRRIIVGRNRSDLKEASEGHWIGGWCDWIWKSPNGIMSRVFRNRKDKRS